METNLEQKTTLRSILDGRINYFDTATQATVLQSKYSVKPAHLDKKKIGLLLIDVQNTFCLPGFELFVQGSVEDTGRLAEFIFRNLAKITEIVPTLDSHTPAQIFHPVFWIDNLGNHPQPGTIFEPDDVLKKRWLPNPAILKSVTTRDYNWLVAYCNYYLETLEKGGRFKLMIWQYHAIVGGAGHALVNDLEKACHLHGFVRQNPVRPVLKGDNPLTESYSVLRPEVLEDQDGRPIGQKNEALINQLLGYNALVIAGQAKSHCVAWTVSDLLAEIKLRKPGFEKKVFLLEDCTSPVIIPNGPDFTEQANQAFAEFKKAGMNIVQSITPIEDWPNSPF